MLFTLTILGWVNRDIDSDSFNEGLGSMIGNLLASLFSLAQPLFAAIGFMTVLLLVIRAIFRKRR